MVAQVVTEAGAGLEIIGTVPRVYMMLSVAGLALVVWRLETLGFVLFLL